MMANYNEKEDIKLAWKEYKNRHNGLKKGFTGNGTINIRSNIQINGMSPNEKLSLKKKNQFEVCNSHEEA